MLGSNLMEPNVLKKILTAIDLTSLNLDDTRETIIQLCQKSKTALGSVAAVCIYPNFIEIAKNILGPHSMVKIATVCNFPSGQAALPDVLIEIKNAIKAGADEIDLVMPYHDFLAGKYQYVHDFIATSKKNCDDKLLKVILETGALQDSHLIARASRDCILAGADFIKTSTGKIATNATLPAAEIMLTTIRDLNLDRTVGFKAAGGIRTLDQALQYLQLAENMMGVDWVSPRTFRIGASQLINAFI